VVTFLGLAYLSLTCKIVRVWADQSTGSPPVHRLLDFQSFIKKPTHHITNNSLCAHDGCPSIEHGRYSDAIKNVVNYNATLRRYPRMANCGSSMPCPVAPGTFEA
jgi:hypothetical protein